MLEISHEDPTFSVALGDGLVVAVWRDAPTGEQLRVLGRAMSSAHRRTPEGSALMNVVTSGTPSFSAEVREEAANLTRTNADKGIASAHVVLLSGFPGVAVRSFFSTIILMGRPSVPTKVFGSLDDAARWLAARVGRVHPHWTADALRRECRDVIES